MTSHEHHHHDPRKKWRRHMWKIPFVILAVVLVKGGLTFWLWNALVPELFHGPTLTFLQAIGLVVLAKLLFGYGPRPGGWGGGHRGGFGPPWRRWEGLSDDERNKLRDEMRRRCGRGDKDPSEASNDPR